MTNEKGSVIDTRQAFYMKPKFLKFLFLANAVLFALGIWRNYVTQPWVIETSESYDGVGARDGLSLVAPGNSSSSSSSSSQIYKVPNIVHYIWFNTATAPLKFHHMLGILSAHKILNPDVIYFHTDREPGGPYWERVRNLPKFKVNFRRPPTEIFGEKVKPPLFYTSHSNVDRVKILMEYGGIYLDLDMIVTKPFDELRKNECVIGQEQATKACGSVIICSKDSFFLTLWINSYLDDYRIDEWAYNTGKVPYNLAKRYPHLVYMEPNRLNHPNFNELDKIWGPNTFDYWNNYAVHLYYRLWKDRSPHYHNVEPDPETIKTMNNTFGKMARSIYYGRTDFILN